MTVTMLQSRLCLPKPLGSHVGFTSRLKCPRFTLARTARNKTSKLVTCEATNDLGVHALVFSGEWTEEACRTAVSGARRCGYSFIEIPLLDPSTVDAAMTKAVLKEYGITASASLGLNLNADISSDDNECARRGEELLMQALDAAAGFGSQYMCGILYSALAKYSVPPTVAGRKNCVAALQRVASAAADRGVTLGLEVVNRYETNLLNTALQAMELLSEIDQPNVMVHLDSYHMHIEEPSMAAAVYTCGDKLGYLHIGESHRGYLASGSVNFTELFRAVTEVEYTGPIVFESFSSRVVSPNLSNTLAIWRNLWDDGEDLAVQARLFIEAEMAAAERHSRLALSL